MGFDSVNDYYDAKFKEARLQMLQQTAAEIGSAYTSIRGDVADQAPVNQGFKDQAFGRFIHLAAQAGVRYQLENPYCCAKSNIIVVTNVLEVCRYARIPQLTYARTSSVYGATRPCRLANTKVPATRCSFMPPPKKPTR